MAYTREEGRAFWYEFDGRTKYDPAMGPVIGASGAKVIQQKFHDAHSAGTYPASFYHFVEPRAAAWTQLATLQRQIIDQHFAANDADLQSAFEDFGAGVLYDPAPERAAADDMIHTMDTGGAPPIGYHRWHASIRAIQHVLPGDAAWWDSLDHLLGLAWAIQSLAQPQQQDHPNPDIAAADLVELRAKWLPLTPAQLDAQYLLRLGTSGYHPDPKNPA